VFVMTVDQRGSMRRGDAVPDLLASLNAEHGEDLLLPFERTAGDEVQALFATAATVVAVTVQLVRDGGWSAGIGIGAVQEPYPPSVRAGRGAAFVAARAAVESAKAAPYRIRVIGTEPAAERAETALWLLAGVLAKRSVHGWEAVGTMSDHQTQRDAADALGISAQAMSRRLAVAGWVEESRGTALSAYLLDQADVSERQA